MLGHSDIYLLKVKTWFILIGAALVWAFRYIPFESKYWFKLIGAALVGAFRYKPIESKYWFI